MERVHLLAGGLVVTGALYMLSRTATGGQVVVAATDAVMNLLPRGVRNNNPGNIEYLSPDRAWRGQIASDGRFRIYDTPANGVRAIAKQLQKYTASGARTVQQYISKWAPSHENPTDAYITNVARLVGVSPTETFDLYQKLPAFVTGVIQQENGRNPYASGDIAKWVYLS